MKKVLVCISLFVALLIASSVSADVGVIPADPGGLFLVDIDGERVVLQFYGSEQAWQYTSEGDDGWYEGLAPHPFDYKIWYPDLTDTYDMLLDEQLDWIDDLSFAGIDDWRIATFWDTIPLKASIFDGIPRLTGPNRVEGYSSEVYFPLTGPRGTWGRTGNEPCGDDPLCDGAIIEIGPNHDFHWEDYPEDGLQVRPGDGTLGGDLLDDWELRFLPPNYPLGDFEKFQ